MDDAALNRPLQKEVDFAALEMFCPASSLVLPVSLAIAGADSLLSGRG